MDLTDISLQGMLIYSLLLLPLFIVYMIYKKKSRLSDIKNKAVFVTGCDTGFGRFLCKQLDAQGCPVFAGCFTESGAQSLQNESSSNLKTLILDVRSAESITNAHKFVVDNLPKDTKLWGVVNNAGIAVFGMAMEFLTRQDYEEFMQVNYIGPVDVILRFLPLIADSKGRIVNISSIIAKMPMPLCGAYVGSKFAIAGFSESLRREKQHWGISVSTIFPGQYSTGMTNKMQAINQLRKYWNQQPNETKMNHSEEDFTALHYGYTNIMDKFGNRKLYEVTNDIEHALFAKHPKACYYPGWDAKLIPILEYLPFDIFPKIQVMAWNGLKSLYKHFWKSKLK